MDKQMSLYDSIHTTLNQYLAHFNVTITDVIRYIGCAGIGFIFGALLKRYGYILVLTLFVLAIFLTTLVYLDIATLHVSAVKSLLGIEHIVTVDELFNTIHTKITQYYIEILVFLVSAVGGFKLG